MSHAPRSSCCLHGVELRHFFAWRTITAGPRGPSSGAAEYSARSHHRAIGGWLGGELYVVVVKWRSSAASLRKIHCSVIGPRVTAHATHRGDLNGEDGSPLP